MRYKKKKNATPVRSKSSLKKLLPGYKSNVINSLALADEEVINYELIAELLEYITLNHEEGAILGKYPFHVIYPQQTAFHTFSDHKLVSTNLPMQHSIPTGNARDYQIDR